MKLGIQSGISDGDSAVVGRAAVGFKELCEQVDVRLVGRLGDLGGGV